MPDRIRLDGRVAVVTGAAGVIGSATIRLLAERGAKIVAVDRRSADLDAACANACSGLYTAPFGIAPDSCSKAARPGANG